MRNKRGFDLRKFVKRAIIITLILALVEVVIIFFFMSDKKGKPGKGQTTSKADTTNTIVNPPAETNASITSTYEDTNAKTNSTAGSSYDNAIAPPAAENSIMDTTALVAAKDSIPKIKKVIKKNLTSKMMSEIMIDIRKQKALNNITANCVQIRKTSESNVDNAFKIAEFLKTNGFIISGRLTVPSNKKGIKISAQENCMILTIGSI